MPCALPEGPQWVLASPAREQHIILPVHINGSEFAHCGRTRLKKREQWQEGEENS